MTVASPVAGSSFMTLPASLFANSMVPSSPAMMPSALLPSHDQTVLHVCPAATTPGIAGDGAAAGASGGGAALAGSALALATCAARCVGGCGGLLHFARTPGYPGCCHACWPVPRGKDDDGPWADAAS